MAVPAIKGIQATSCVYAREPKYYEIIRREVTVDKVREYFGDMVKGEIVPLRGSYVAGF